MLRLSELWSWRRKCAAVNAPRDTMAEIVDLISDSDDDAPPPAPAQALPAFVTADRLVEDLSDHSEDERLLRGGADAKPAKRARVEAPVFAAARPAAAGRGTRPEAETGATPGDPGCARAGASS